MGMPPEETCGTASSASEATSRRKSNLFDIVR